MATKTQTKSVATTTGRTTAQVPARSNTPKGKPGSALAVIDEQFQQELAGDSGKGFEEATRDAFAIPFLVVLQDLSPQTKKSKSEFIEGAKPGQFYQTVSQDLLDTVRVIPCHFSQVFIEWVPRNKGGGFVAAYETELGTLKMRTAVRDGGKSTLPNGNELYDTRQHFVLLIMEDGSTHPALIAMKSASLKVSRRWMSQMQTATIEVVGNQVQPPMFAWSYLLSTEEESNDQGAWYQWVIGDRERVTDIGVYRKAKAFGASMSQGKVKVNYDEMQRTDVAGSGKDVPGDLNNEIDA